MMHRRVAAVAVAGSAALLVACGSPGTGWFAADTTFVTPTGTSAPPPTTVDSADPLLRTLVSTEWEIVTLEGTGVADVLGPFTLRFWGDGTYQFTGGCPSGSHGSYTVDGGEVRFEAETSAGTPAIACLGVDDLLQGRLFSIVDHGMDVSRFSAEEIHASTVFPRAFALVLRPAAPPGP